MKIDHGPTTHGGYKLVFDAEIEIWITAVILKMPVEPLKCWVAETLDRMVRQRQIDEESAVLGFHFIMDYVAANAQNDSNEAEKLEVVG